MENAIATLASRVSPEAQNKGAPEGLKTGHINHGVTLFETFADDGDNTKVIVIQRLAGEMTCIDFGQAVKDAQAIADNTDSASGWKAPADAKGADKYGPKRSVLNARMSEAKALFGAYKIDPSVLKEKGYWLAIKAARELLDSKGVKWDGTPKPTDADKAAKKAVRASDAALAQAQKLNPQKAGESMKEYILRVADLADVLAENAAIDVLVKALGALHEDKEMLHSALFYYLKAQGPDVMEACAEQLFDAAAEMRGQPSMDAPF